VGIFLEYLKFFPTLVNNKKSLAELGPQEIDEIPGTCLKIIEKYYS